MQDKTVKLQNVRVILIGGTSHAGKSTLGEALALRLGWVYQSTDKLARHPGRPWQTPPKTVPPHVAEHYLSLPVDELIADVVRHYTQTVWPLVEEMVSAHTNDPLRDCLVIEGSALLPELAARLTHNKAAMVWLTASPEFLKQRIYGESDYENKTPLEQKMIHKFMERTVRFNERMAEAVSRLGLTLINVENFRDTKELLTVCFSELQKQEGEPEPGGEN